MPQENACVIFVFKGIDTYSKEYMLIYVFMVIDRYLHNVLRIMIIQEIFVKSFELSYLFAFS